MIRKYLPDIVSLCAIVLIVGFVAVWQNVTLNVRPQVVVQAPGQTKIPAAKQDQKSIFNLAVAADALKQRNIFAETGSYVVTKKALQAPPAEKIYTLLGVLDGKERKAVLRDELGVVTFCKVGKKLPRWHQKKTDEIAVKGMDSASVKSDGKKEDKDVFVVVRIDSTSVKLKGKAETKELKIFNVQYKPPKR